MGSRGWHSRLLNYGLAASCFVLAYWSYAGSHEFTFTVLIFVAIGFLALFTPNRDPEQVNLQAAAARTAQLEQLQPGQRELVRARIDAFESGQLKLSMTLSSVTVAVCVILLLLARVEPGAKDTLKYFFPASLAAIFCFSWWHAGYMKRAVQSILEDELSVKSRS